MKEKNNIEENVLLEVQNEEGENGGHLVRVVQWIVNGKKTQPFLEKRSYIKSNGSRFYKKMKGFNKKDLNAIADKWDNIAGVMEAN